MSLAERWPTRRTPVVDDMNGMVPTGKAKVGANLQGPGCLWEEHEVIVSRG